MKELLIGALAGLLFAVATIWRAASKAPLLDEYEIVLWSEGAQATDWDNEWKMYGNTIEYHHFEYDALTGRTKEA